MNFIFTLINPGCFVTIEERGVIISEGFYVHVDDFKASEDFTLFNKKRRATAHIFIDLREQYYTLDTLPSMSAWKRKKVLHHKCQVENPRLQSIHFRKESKNAYLFTDLALSENHLDWIQFLEKRGHPLKAPRLLPVEIESLLHNRMLVTPPEKECLVVIYYEELVGLRQLVFMNGKLRAARFPQIVDKDTKKQIALETDDLICYLAAERGIDPAAIGLVILGNAAPFAKLSPIALTIVDWSRFQKTSLKKGLPFNSWSMLALAVLRQQPTLPLKLECLAAHRHQERRRLTFIAGGFLCLWVLALGSFFVQKYQQRFERRLQHLEKALNTFPKNTPSDILSLSPKEQTLAHGYAHLKAATPNPFLLLDETQEWLQDHWQLKHIEWGYHSPKFKREAWVLDSPTHTHETLDLWVDYLGSDSLQQQAREAQILMPLKNHKVMKNTHIKEIEVIRILKEGMDL